MELWYLTFHFPLFFEWRYKSSELNQNFSLMRHVKIFPEFLAGNSREVHIVSNVNTSFKLHTLSPGTVYKKLIKFFSSYRYVWFTIFGTDMSPILNTQYMRNPDMVYVLKMEYVSKINIFGLKMMVKSGLEKIFLKFLHAQGAFQASWFTS